MKGASKKKKEKRKRRPVMGTGHKKSVGHSSSLDRDVNVGTIPTMALYKCN